MPAPMDHYYVRILNQRLMGSRIAGYYQDAPAELYADHYTRTHGAELMAHPRSPIDVTRQGWPTSWFQA